MWQESVQPPSLEQTARSGLEPQPWPIRAGWQRVTDRSGHRFRGQLCQSLSQEWARCYRRKQLRLDEAPFPTVLNSIRDAHDVTQLAELCISRSTDGVHKTSCIR